ncbi:hypothetical protein DNTS_009055 [Danionella cerebrum]|uniref:Uncharacterized protein n=1 Tax=Danionella cerebrum TaxID=2873325 RepID=A0A553N436_9TELE|nr:hypothetical protein DNTS_009055 [Danionella translucida]
MFSTGRSMLTWAAETQRSSPAHSLTRASNIASASRLRARLWACSSPVVVPLLVTVSSRIFLASPYTAVTQTCATVLPTGLHQSNSLSVCSSGFTCCCDSCNSTPCWSSVVLLQRLLYGAGARTDPLIIIIQTQNIYQNSNLNPTFIPV